MVSLLVSKKITSSMTIFLPSTLACVGGGGGGAGFGVTFTSKATASRRR